MEQFHHLLVQKKFGQKRHLVPNFRSVKDAFDYSLNVKAEHPEDDQRITTTGLKLTGKIGRVMFIRLWELGKEPLP